LVWKSEQGPQALTARKAGLIESADRVQRQSAELTSCELDATTLI